MSKQSDLVNITQGDADINGGTIDGTIIGGSTPAAVTGTAGSFSNLSVNNNPIATAGSLSNRNKIINGNFDFWQRGTSGSSGYVADRWSTAVSGSTAAISRQSFTLGQTDVPGEPDYYHRTVVTSSAGASNYAITLQPIESVKTLAGQTATLSFWAKADASKNMAVDFIQNFGSGGSPSATVVGIDVTTIALTASWQKFTVTVDVPSISGKTLGTNNNDLLGVFFWFDAGSDYDSRTNTLGQQSGTFDIARVQLEAGDVATPFEERPIGTELALCQRYYNKSYPPDLTPGIAANGGYGAIYVNEDIGNIGRYASPVRFPVVMRATPTVTVYPGRGDVTATAGYVAQYNAAVISAVTQGPFATATGWNIIYAGSYDQIALAYTADAEL